MDTKDERDDNDWDTQPTDQATLSGNDITKEQIRDVYMAGTSDGVVLLNQGRKATLSNQADL
jgi:hypothetical protein